MDFCVLGRPAWSLPRAQPRLDGMERLADPRRLAAHAVQSMERTYRHFLRRGHRLGVLSFGGFLNSQPDVGSDVWRARAQLALLLRRGQSLYLVGCVAGRRLVPAQHPRNPDGLRTRARLRAARRRRSARWKVGQQTPACDQVAPNEPM